MSYYKCILNDTVCPGAMKHLKKILLIQYVMILNFDSMINSFQEFNWLFKRKQKSMKK